MDVDRTEAIEGKCWTPLSPAPRPSVAGTSSPARSTWASLDVYNKQARSLTASPILVTFVPPKEVDSVHHAPHMQTFDSPLPSASSVVSSEAHSPTSPRSRSGSRHRMRSASINIPLENPDLYSLLSSGPLDLPPVPPLNLTAIAHAGSGSDTSVPTDSPPAAIEAPPSHPSVVDEEDTREVQWTEASIDLMFEVAVHHGAEVAAEIFDPAIDPAQTNEKKLSPPI